jgi:hypothetical protein
MTNFEAKIRRDYRDVEGLVLDCHESGLALDGSLWTNRAPAARVVRQGSHTGSGNASVLLDSNAFYLVEQLVGCNIYNVTDGSSGLITGNTNQTVTATLTGGTDNDWDNGDSYVITTYRFGDAVQNTVANRPTVSTGGSGFREAEFVAASSQFFEIPLEYTSRTISHTIAFEYLTKASTGNGQHVFGTPDIRIKRKDGSGNYGYYHNATNVNGVGDMQSGLWLLSADGASTGDLWRNGVVDLSGTYTDTEIAASSGSAFIGTNTASTGFCDIILRGIQVWRRMLSPLEIDFAYATLSPETDYSQQDRLPIQIAQWTDDTGSGSGEIPRISTLQAVPHRFYLAQIDRTAVFGKIQIAATINGLVVPDSSLGGELFQIDCIEYPSAGKPHIFQDSGWSSVFDVQFSNDPGHYTFVVYRQNGGAEVLHVDLETVL